MNYDIKVNKDGFDFTVINKSEVPVKPVNSKVIEVPKKQELPKSPIEDVKELNKEALIFYLQKAIEFFQNLEFIMTAQLRDMLGKMSATTQLKHDWRIKKMHDTFYNIEYIELEADNGYSVVLYDQKGEPIHGFSLAKAMVDAYKKAEISETLSKISRPKTVSSISSSHKESAVYMYDPRRKSTKAAPFFKHLLKLFK